MNKKLIALAVAGVISGYGAAANAADVSGYAVVDYTITDDGGANSGADGIANTADDTNDTEGKFGAKGELDFSASPADGVTVRIDVDVTLAGTTTGATATDGTPAHSHDYKDKSGSAKLEQAFFAWSATDSVTVIGGVFNNPIGYEAEDKPDMIFNSHGHVYGALDSQTALDGDNVAGLAVAGAVGPVTLTGALLNDLGGVNEENSIAIIANYSPMAGLDLEVGMATQTGNALLGDTTVGATDTSVGDVTNFNVVYTGVEGLEVGVDYLMADEALDTAYDLWAGYSVTKAVAVNARISESEFDGGGTIETTAFNASYKVASNLKAILEVSSTDVGSVSSDLTNLKLVATF